MQARVLEPEVMDTAEEAAGYDAMDHAAVNQKFCEDFVAFRGPGAGSILDVGTGTALIPIALAKLTRDVEILGIDLAEHMLTLARKNIAAQGLADRIRVQSIDAKAMPFRDGEFRAVISNSIVHHIPEPSSVIREMHRVAASGGVVFVRDLVRPEGDADVERLVARYGGDAPLPRGQFRDSLRAALTLDEVRALVTGAGVTHFDLRLTSDRHWTLAYVKS